MNVSRNLSPPQSKAELQIGNGSANLAYSALGDLQYFVRELLPGRGARLIWKPGTEIGQELPKEKPIVEDFYSLIPARLKELPLYTGYRLEAEGQEYHLLKLRNVEDSRLIENVFGIFQFSFSGKSPEVERALDLIGQLFEKNPFWNPKYVPGLDPRILKKSE